MEGTDRRAETGTGAAFVVSWVSEYPPLRVYVVVELRTGRVEY